MTVIETVEKGAGSTLAELFDLISPLVAVAMRGGEGEEHDAIISAQLQLEETAFLDLPNGEETRTNIKVNGSLAHPAALPFLLTIDDLGRIARAEV